MGHHQSKEILKGKSEFNLRMGSFKVRALRRIECALGMRLGLSWVAQPGVRPLERVTRSRCLLERMLSSNSLE